jgi:UDP-N-acetylglucosamine 2-epimerase (non-hydrolysing)
MRARVLSIVGTRPNFVKMAPVVAELQNRAAFEHLLVHTGQHYDKRMSQIFLDELGVGHPDRMLRVGSGTHAVQTARVMERLEPIILDWQPDLVLVPGDVNSTLAAALTASKLGVTVGHVEAGLRSFDRSMPEEINRVLTDQVSDLLFTHSPEARRHLLREGCAEGAIHEVGNTMIDTLLAMRKLIDPDAMGAAHGVRRGDYLVVTLHRPALVDGPLLADAVRHLAEVSRSLPVVFPVHPRTRAAITRLGDTVDAGRLRLVDPLGYVDFLGLVSGAAGVLTDSGGIQEETTVLGIPCLTLRANTERPVTVEHGTNVLLGLDPKRISDVPDLIAAARERRSALPVGWDGVAAGRLVDVLQATGLGLTASTAAS